MEGVPTSKRCYKLKKNRGSESKCNLKECTPIKAELPRDHSTPVESETIPRISPTTEVEHKDVNEAEDDDEHSPFQFHCTQDTLAVGWDGGSPQHRSRLKLGSKVKRKLSKGNSFAHKKQSVGSCSPIEPLHPRRRFNIEKPAGDFSELIPQLQGVADLVKKMKDQDAKTTHYRSFADEICMKSGRNLEANFTRKEEEGNTSSDVEDVFAVDTLKNEEEVDVNGAQKMKGQCDVTPCTKLNVSKENQNETFTALFDDDADEFMLQCSQEIEEKLNTNVPVVCSGNKGLSLPGYTKNCPVPVQSEIRSPESCKPVRSLEFSSNNIKKPNNPKVGTKCYMRIKSGTPKYSKDEHFQCHSSRYSSSASAQLHSGKTKMDLTGVSSKSPSASGLSFDDSFDAVIQNLTEDDMKMLSQGHVVEKKEAGNIACVAGGKQFCQKVEDITEVNCGTGNVLQLAAGRPSINNRQLKYVNQGTARNEMCVSRISNMQFKVKVPSGICNNQNLSDCANTFAPLQLNETHSNKNVLPVNNEMFVTLQGHSTSTIKKNCDIVCPGPSTPAPTTVPISPPLKCTPEEIRKKRLEAKKKLEKKRLTMLSVNEKQYRRSKDL